MLARIFHPRVLSCERSTCQSSGMSGIFVVKKSHGATIFGGRNLFRFKARRHRGASSIL